MKFWARACAYSLSLAMCRTSRSRTRWPTRSVSSVDCGTDLARVSSRNPALELDHAAGAKHLEGHLVPGAELRLARPHFFEARFVLELDAHRLEHDVAAKRNVLALDLRDNAARSKSDGLGGRLLRHFLGRQAEGLREIEVLRHIAAHPEPGDPAPEGTLLEHQLA